MLQKIDNFFNENDYLKVTGIVNSLASWEFSGQSKNSDEPTFWYASLDDNYELLELFKNALNNKFCFNEIDVKAFYANGQNHGQCGGFHADSLDERCRTLLFYANSEWSVDWAVLLFFWIQVKK